MILDLSGIMPFIAVTVIGSFVGLLLTAHVDVPLYTLKYTIPFGIFVISLIYFTNTGNIIWN